MSCELYSYGTTKNFINHNNNYIVRHYANTIFYHMCEIIFYHSRFPRNKKIEKEKLMTLT